MDGRGRLAQSLNGSRRGSHHGAPGRAIVGGQHHVHADGACSRRPRVRVVSACCGAGRSGCSICACASGLRPGGRRRRCFSPRSAMAWSKGDHVPPSCAALKDARDAAANAAGFRIASLALTGEHHVSREEILATAGVTGTTSLLFLDVDAARERLKTNPWIADATVLKLYPDRAADQHQGARGLRALAEGRPGLGHRRRRHRARALRRPAPDRACRSWSASGRAARRKDFLALLERYPDIREQVRASILVGERRWNLRLRTASTCACRKTTSSTALETLVALDRDKKLLSRDIVAVDLRLPDRVTVRLSDAAAACALDALKDKKPEEGGQRMSALQHGLTPKIKPLSPKRSALVAALDVGTSKIACLIAPLKPQSAAGRAAPPQPHHRRARLRPHRARGMKAGAVVDLADAEAAIRQAVDLAERSAKMQLESVVVSVSAGQPGSELISASVDVAGSAVAEGDIARVLAAGSRHSVRAGPRRAAFAADRLFARRRHGHPRPARHARPSLRHRHARGDRRRCGGAQPDAGGRALPSRRRGDGGEPLCGGTVGARRRRGRSRRRA